MGPMCTLVSTMPGVTYFPAPSMTRAPAGTVTEARGPISAIRCPRITMVASESGGPPFPSITVAPTIAVAPSCA